MAAAVLAGPAWAATSCDAAHLYSYSFATASTQQLSYASSYAFSGTNGLSQSQSFTTSFATYGLSSSQVAGMQMPQVTNLINDGNPTTANNLMIGMVLAARTTSISANTNVVVTKFTFTVPVREIAIEMNDVDFASNQYRDWVSVTGSDGTTTFNPTLTTPFGTNNTGGPTTSGSSTLQLGASSTPVTVAVNEVIGTSTNPNTANGGTVNVSFAQPVTSVQIRYGNSNQSTGGTSTGQQAFGIQSLTWCAMPALVVAKTSTPLATSGALSYNIPGADLVYSIALSNTGGSDLDLATLSVVDTMPGATAFFNGAFSGTVASPFQTVTSGGASATPTVTYSTNGTTYTYTPATGYDSAVKAFKVSGAGTIPPGGGVTLSFRAQIR